MASTEAVCYCGNQKTAHSGSAASTTTYSAEAIISQRPISCHPCATRRLSSQISRYQSASQNHAQKREECHRRLLDTRLPPAYADASDDNVSQHLELEPLSSRKPLPDPSQINQKVSMLKQRLDMLRSQSNDLAVRVTAKTMENDEREEQLQSDSAKVQLARERLDRMRQCLLMEKHTDDDDGILGGGLKDALVSGTRQIQSLRFHFACRVFDMHRLDVGEQYSKEATKNNTENDNDNGSKKGNESATGVGKIGSLPLPHAGPVLYGVIPPVVLASSLRLVASLTQLVARCLGVVLPHPILVCFKECRQCGMMYDFGGDVVDATIDDGCDEDEEYLDDSMHDSKHDLCATCCNEGSSENAIPERPQQAKSQSSTSVQSNRKSSLLSLVGFSARKAIAITSSATTRAITHMQQSSSASMDSASPDPLMHNTSMQSNPSVKSASNEGSKSSQSISRRVKHASFAYLRENNDKSATEYVLNPPRWKEEGIPKSSDSGDPKRSQSHPNHGTNHAQTFSCREEFHVAEERFATGMQLLQNDVVALCFRAGVDVSTLWPAESVLLNLYSLWRHCQKMAARGTSQ